MGAQPFIITLTDGNGNAASGAKCYAYQKGTTTPQNVFSNSGLSVAASNPVVADADGKLQFYLNDTLNYTLRIRNAADSVTLFEADYEAGADSFIIVYDGTVVGALEANKLLGGNADAAVAAVTAGDGLTLSDNILSLDSVLTTVVPASNYGMATSGTGAANATALQAAIDAAAALGGGRVAVGIGEFLCDPVTLKQGVVISGQGFEATSLKLPNGTDDDLITTDGASALFGTGNTTGVRGCGLEHIALNGNKANNSSGRGLVAYWYSSFMRDVRIHDFADEGIFEEWGDFGAPEPFGGMENHYTNVLVNECDGDASWYHNGPHDSRFFGCAAIQGTGFAGVHVGPRGDGAMFVNCHPWGYIQQSKTPDWALVCDGDNVMWANSTAEGGDQGQILIRSPDCSVIGGHQYTITPSTESGGAAVKGIQIGHLLAVSSITRTDAVATVTCAAAHGARAGYSVTIAGADQSDYNGTFTIASIVSATVFTIPVANSPTTPATGTITSRVGSAPSGYNIKTKLTNFEEGAIVFSADGGLGRVDVDGYNGNVASNYPTIQGTPALTTSVKVDIEGPSGSYTAVYEESMRADFNFGLTAGAGESAQFPSAGLVAAETTHPTSMRAQINVGTKWSLIQDTAGDGTPNLGVYDVDAANYPILIDNGTVLLRDTLPPSAGGASLGSVAAPWFKLVTQRLGLTLGNVPANAAATGTTGDIGYDADYIYICVATNTWKRVAISTW